MWWFCRRYLFRRRPSLARYLVLSLRLSERNQHVLRTNNVVKVNFAASGSRLNTAWKASTPPYDMVTIVPEFKICLTDSIFAYLKLIFSYTTNTHTTPTNPSPYHPHKHQRHSIQPSTLPPPQTYRPHSTPTTPIIPLMITTILIPETVVFVIIFQHHTIPS